MAGSRMSAELEGSSVGSSSREGDRPTRIRQHGRHTAGGGFLLDTSLSPRIDSFGSSPSQSPKSAASEKRRAVEPRSTTSNKRFRYPWNGGHAEASSPLARTASSGADADEVSSGPSERRRSTTNRIDQNATASMEGGGREEGELGSVVGLNKDTEHIVNLALNLSGSRKRGLASRSSLTPLSGSRRTVSERHSPAYSPQAVPPSGLGRYGISPWEGVPFSAEVGAPSTTIGSPDGSVDAISFESISDATLQRAKEARLHFNLFHEYIRLLSLLPPLRHPKLDSTADAILDEHDSRKYNPLQAIRNRKIRFREGSAADPAKFGWNDAVKVREWVDAVEDTYRNDEHDPDECLRLPPLHQSEMQVVRNKSEAEMLPVSPTTSLKRASSRMRFARPRIDWIVSPEELLSDAAWTEEGINKSKIVDRDRNKLYPDPSELVIVGDHRGRQDLSPSVSERRRRSSERARVGRGGPRQASESSRSRISSEADKRRHKWSASRGRRSRSVSNDRMSQDNYSLDANRIDGRHHHGRVDPSSLVHRDESRINPEPIKLAEPRRHPRAGAIPKDEGENVNAGASKEGLDQVRYDVTSRPDHLPSVAFVPSSSSSRSSSRSRRHLSRMIHSIHGRSRSRHEDKELEGHDGHDLLLASDKEHKPSTGESPGERANQAESPNMSKRPSLSRRGSSWMDDLAGADDARGRGTKESRIRGMFKSGGRISDIVSSEVSKVGDLLKKETGMTHSRRPSLLAPLPPSAPASSSSSSEDEEEPPNGEMVDNPDSESAGSRKPLLEDSGRPGQPSNRGNPIPKLPVFTSPKGRPSPSENGELPAKVESSTKIEYAKSVNMGAMSRSQKNGRIDSTPSTEAGESGISLAKIKEPGREDRNKASSVASAPGNIPITTPSKANPFNISSTAKRKRSDMVQSSRSWSLSDRSTKAGANIGLPDKREIERARALLLCSGIKAREIVRQAGSGENPPASVHSKSTPRTPRMEEHRVAARNLEQQFQQTRRSIQLSMERFSDRVCVPLKLELDDLDSFVTLSLEHRVRLASTDAERLILQLNTSTTLATKQLSDVLDRAIRRRQGRLQWLRRLGFVVLEWVVIVLMWCVWLFVMVFKVIRGILRGFIATVKWILWL